ncbi:MAG: hypothetical protein AAF572_06640 [Cyanobacteria bacterium P01_B01_bin.77]
MLSSFLTCLRVSLLSAIGIALLPLAAHAEATVAYCDSPLYAVNVYQDSTSESSGTSLRIRVFWREKSLVFADLLALRSNSFAEGFTYTSQSELSNDYSASLWTLFVPNSEGQSCLLFRNGVAFDSGSVTQREL